MGARGPAPTPRDLLPFGSWRRGARSDEVQFPPGPPSCPKALTGEARKEWRRVVAVFTGGKEYEFKQFPNGPKPVDVFSKYKGFHLRYEDEPLDPNVAKWNVVVVVVHKAAAKRYLDRVCTLKIFEELDKVIK